MRGISAIISIVLLLMITIAMTGFFYVWMSGTMKTNQEGTEKQLEATADKMSSCIQLDSASGNKIYVRNCGIGKVASNSLSIFIDNTPINFSMAGNISESSTGEITIISNVQPGTHSLKITGIGMGIDEKADLCTTNCSGTSPTTTSSTTTSSSTTSSTTTTLTTTTIGPVGYWAFSEGTGNFTTDSSGKGNTGYLRAGALKFDGSGDLANCGNSSSLVMTSMTLEAWIKPQGSAVQPIIEFNNGATFGVHMWQYDSFGKLFVNFVDITPASHAMVSSSGVISSGNWYHVAATYNGSYGTLYINGVAINSTNLGSFTPRTATSGYKLYIGARISGPNWYNGTIDEVRIYNRAVPAAEMLQHYKGNFSNNAGLVLYIPFTEWSGTTTNDYSGMGNTGTLYNFTNTTAGAGDSSSSGWTTYGRPFWTNAGKYGNALNFNGLDDYVSVSNTVLDGATNLTAEFWAKTADGIAGIITGANETQFNEFLIYTTPTMNIYAHGYLWTSNVSFSDGLWHHIAVTRTNTIINIYKDGVLAASNTSIDSSMSGPIDIAPGGLLIGQEQDALGGALDPAQAFNGTLDSVRIYNRTLTAAQIVSDMSS